MGSEIRRLDVTSQPAVWPWTSYCASLCQFTCLWSAGTNRTNLTGSLCARNELFPMKCLKQCLIHRHSLRAAIPTSGSGSVILWEEETLILWGAWVSASAHSYEQIPTALRYKSPPQNHLLWGLGLSSKCFFPHGKRKELTKLNLSTPGTFGLKCTLFSPGWGHCIGHRTPP